MKTLRVWAYFVRLSLRSALTDWRLSLMSILSVALLALLWFGTAMVFRTVEQTFLAFGRNAVVVAFAGNESVADLREKILGALCREPEVAQCSEKTAQEARADFVRENPDLADTVRMLEENPFLHSFHVHLKASDHPLDAIVKISSALKAMPGVSSVEDGEKWLLGWSQLLRFFREGFWILGGLISVCILFLFFAVISLLVHRQKNQMDILSLVGATRFTIALPFAVQGMLQTFLGALLAAFAIETASSHIRSGMLREFGITLIQWGTFSWWEAWIAVGTFSGLGVLGSVIAVRKCLQES